MERTEIKTAALAMKNVKDLRRVLNLVKRDALGEKSHPFHLKQITYYCNPRRTEVKRYVDFTIPKKSGGERVISAPVAGLKSILTSLNTILQSLYEPTKYAMGFVPGRSVVDNAKLHLGQNYVYNLDLQDFFPSIDKSRVWKRLTIKPFNFPSELADVIAGLCTMRLEVEGQEPRYVLPQGAPTSPTLTNIICEKLDRQLGGLARKYGLRYSRYADDITFSSMHYVYSEEGDFVRELHEIIAANRFTINDKKTRLQKLGARQEVTGLVLSDKVNVVRTYTRELRTLLHIWEKYGPMAAKESYMRHRKSDASKKGAPNLEAVLMGKLQYLKMVKGEEDATYRTLSIRLGELLDGAKKSTKYTNAITYLHTMSKEEFEQALATSIEYNAEATPNLFFTMGGVVRPISTSRSVNVKELFAEGKAGEDMWKDLQISLCANKSAQFYLLHKKYINPKNSKDKSQEERMEDLAKELKALVGSTIFSQVLGEEQEEDVYSNIDLSEVEALAAKDEKWNEVLNLSKELDGLENKDWDDILAQVRQMEKSEEETRKALESADWDERLAQVKKLEEGEEPTELPNNIPEE